MKRFGKRTMVVLAVAVAASVAAVAGYAYWTSTGTGNGSATVGTDTPWAVVAAPATGGPLTPAGPSQTVLYTVTNNSSGNQLLTSVTVSVANTNGTAWDGPGTCSANDFSLNGAAAGAAHVHTALQQTFVGGYSDSASVNVQMVDTGFNQNDCRGVTVPLHFVAS